MLSSITLRSGSSEATLLPSRGGLLSQLKLQAGGPEAVPLLWMPETFSPVESGWPGGGMPVLFPLAGRQFHGERALHYVMGGRTYHMPLHGFAYALPWTVTKQEAHSAELTLRSGETTYELFPFDFTVVARYSLEARELQLNLRVTSGGGRADANAPMPLAMGLHPFFNAPFAGGSLDHCHLETPAHTKTRVTPAGTAGKSAPFPEGPEEKRGALTEPVLRNLILGELSGTEASLVDTSNARRISIAWSEGIRYLVLWSQEGKGFYCVEPWMGLPDALHNGEGLHWLERGASYELSVRIALKVTAKQAQ